MLTLPWLRRPLRIRASDEHDSLADMAAVTRDTVRTPAMYSIGEFSKITGLTVKTLRFYHEQSVLEPTSIDPSSGYRYYGEDKVELARVIAKLREFDFPLADIREILEHHDDADILEFLEQQMETIRRRLRDDQRIVRTLDSIIQHEREARNAMSHSPFQVEEKEVPSQLIAGVRMKGRYSDCGKGFALLGRKFGRHIAGKAFLLCYDKEYREEDADFETCFPVRKAVEVEGVDVRELAGGRCLSLLHRGPYNELGRTYEAILQYAKQRDWQLASPCREVYLKGPGMIFRGNPKKYLTEIQFFCQSLAGEASP